jgi:hypothetical protein
VRRSGILQTSLRHEDLRVAAAAIAAARLAAADNRLGVCSEPFRAALPGIVRKGFYRAARAPAAAPDSAIESGGRIVRMRHQFFRVPSGIDLMVVDLP